MKIKLTFLVKFILTLTYQDKKYSLEYRLLKHRYRLLLTSGIKIDRITFSKDHILGYTCTQQKVLDEVLKIDQELYQAYQLKERYLDFDSTSKKDINQKDMKAELNDLIHRYLDSGIEECIEVGKTLQNWKDEILNSFVWIENRRISNGMIEGKNNYIKKMLFNANGMSNFDRARDRFMYSLNKYETYTMKVKDRELIKEFKKKKKKSKTEDIGKP